MTHWAIDYIGLPWIAGGVGPSAYDCWGLVAHVQRTRFDRSMPSIDLSDHGAKALTEIVAKHDERRNWSEVLNPIEGDVVLMARHSAAVHVGVWITDRRKSGALHCAERIGVLFSDPHALRGMGWGRLSYFRWNH